MLKRLLESLKTLLGPAPSPSPCLSRFLSIGRAAARASLSRTIKHPLPRQPCAPGEVLFDVCPLLKSGGPFFV